MSSDPVSLKALVERWRKKAREQAKSAVRHALDKNPGPLYNRAADAMTLSECADELEAALSGASPADPAPTRFVWLMERRLTKDEGTLQRTPKGTLVYWDGGHAESFTTDLRKAKHWPTKDAAIRDCPPGHYAQWGWNYVEHGFMANSSVVARRQPESASVAIRRSSKPERKVEALLGPERSRGGQP